MTFLQLFDRAAVLIIMALFLIVAPISLYIWWSSMPFWTSVSFSVIIGILDFVILALMISGVLRINERTRSSDNEFSS